MSAGQPIGNREREILTAIVETYISTGEPVGSRVLSRGSREGLSPATIRNVMADLADAGYLEQPHTSAGRVPSTSAYRYYVEQLSGRTQLSQADAGVIEDSLRGVNDVQEFMTSWSRPRITVITLAGSKEASYRFRESPSPGTSTSSAGKKPWAVAVRLRSCSPQWSGC